MVSSNDVRRLFLQSVLSRGVLSEKLARIVWTKCVQAVKAADDSLDIEHSDTQVAWENFVQSVNASLNDLHFEFRLYQDEVTGKRMYALINAKDDEIAQLATDYTPGEIAYFKAIVELIMLAPHEAYSVSSMTALREVSHVKPKLNMTKTQAETVLNSFVARGWLLKSKKGRYSLSSRTIVELQAYLKSHYEEDQLECTICSDMVTKGIACHTPKCKARLHYHCFKTYRRRKDTCPACNKDWPTEANKAPLIPVGEAAAREGDDARRSQRHGSEDSDEPQTLFDENSQRSQAQSTRQKRAKRGGKKTVIDEDEEEEEDDDQEEDEEDEISSSKPKRRSTRKQS